MSLIKGEIWLTVKICLLIQINYFFKCSIKYLSIHLIQADKEYQLK